MTETLAPGDSRTDPGPPSRRISAIAFGGIALVLVAAVVAIVVAVQRGRETDERRSATRAPMLPPGSAVYASVAASGRPEVHLRTPDGSFRRLGRLPKGTEGVMLAPDGTRLAWIRNNTLWVGRADGSAAHKVATGLMHAQCPGARWVDAMRLAYSTEQDVRIVDADGRNGRRLSAATSMCAPGVRPDLSLMLIVGDQPSIVDLAMGKTRPLTVPSGHSAEAEGGFSADGRWFTVGLLGPTDTPGELRYLIYDVRTVKPVAQPIPGKITEVFFPPGGGLAVHTPGMVTVLDSTLRTADRFADPGRSMSLLGVLPAR